jgi:cell division protein ZapA
VSTEVRILGKNYSVRSEFDDRFTNETAELVNARVRELIQKMGPISTEKIAVLAAMNFAGELLKAQREAEEQRKFLIAKTEKLIKLIDSQL